MRLSKAALTKFVCLALFVSVATPAVAVPLAPNPADFSITESVTGGGIDYKVINNSDDWYVITFWITHDANTSGPLANRAHWTSDFCDTSCPLGAPQFYYFNNADVLFNNPIGPHQSSDPGDFVASTGFLSSNWMILVVDAAGIQNQSLDSLQFVPGSTTPIPGALPLFVSGLGALAFLARRRKQRAAA